MAYDGMDNAMTNQANKQSGLLRRFGLTGAVIVAACLAAGATFLGYGVDANLPWPVTSNTTIAAKYCGGTVLAGTGSTGQFTLTLPAVTGFPSNCSVLIKNGDSTNTKTLSGFPADLYATLWPKQSVGVKIVNGAWQTFYNPGAYLPVNGITLYASPSGTGDCLSAATACTLPTACLAVKQIAAFLGSPNIVLAHGIYSMADVSNNQCSVSGNVGGSSSLLTSINGDAANPTAVVIAIQSGQNGFVIQDGGEAGINNLEITNVNGGGPGILCRQNAVCDYSNITWGSWGNSGSHLAVTGVAASANPGNETLANNTSFVVHWNVSGGASLQAGGTTTIGSSVSWSASFALANNASLDLSSWTLAGTGTGSQFSGTGPGFLNSATTCASLFPGTGGCSLALGFQDGARDGTTSGLLGVPSGGTGNATATAHSIPVSEGTSAQVALGPCTSSQVIVGQGSSSDPACGAVPAAALPTPTTSTLGGVESIASLAHNWIASIDTSGVPHQSQPATSDLSDVTAPTTWTATDGSGAGLTFATNADTRYVKNGKVCIVSFMIQWPTTSDTHTAQINGIPSACTAYNGTFNWVAGGAALTGLSSIGSGIAWVALQAGGTSLFFYGNANPMTNANMSGGVVRGTITYITN